MSVEAIAGKWHDHLLSTQAVDHAVAEAAVSAAYRAAGLDEPRHFLWCASPLEAAWAALVAIGKADPYNQAVLEEVERSKTTRSKLPEVRASVAARLGVPAEQADGCFGKPFYRAEGASPIAKQLSDQSVDSWMARAESGEAFLAPHKGGPFHRLHQLEEALFFEGFRARGGGKGSLYNEAVAAAGAKPLAPLVLRSAQHRLYGSLAFIEIAMDEALAEAGKLQPTELQQAMWAAYQACGLWWPCERGVVLAERPSVAVPTADGARLEWADGFTVGGPPSVKAAAGTPAPAPAAPASTPTLSATALPRDRDARIAFLRRQAPELPHFDRYMAGEHAQVWADLVALGDRVRQDELAADALAVAYETMDRVRQNVGTLAQRLEALGYRFIDPSSGGLFGLRKPKAHSPHVPPAADSASRLRALETAAGGPVPMALSAFFDVVGEVNFLGEHPALAPKGASSPDALFVYGVTDAIDCVESWDDEDEKMVVIAPDALHKANIGGGDPYMIAVPAAAADVLLEEEPHGVTFVEYLRIAILRWGGFPGWQAEPRPPAEIDRLREGLISF